MLNCHYQKQDSLHGHSGVDAQNLVLAGMSTDSEIAMIVLCAALEEILKIEIVTLSLVQVTRLINYLLPE